MDGEFIILSFPDPEDAPVAYAEDLFGDVPDEAFRARRQRASIVGVSFP